MKNEDKHHIETEKEFHEAEDEMVMEELDEEADEAAIRAKLKKLRDKLKKVEAEKMEYLTGWQRAKADLINARKRDDEERKEFTKYANERLIDGLIPVLESFDMAMGNREAWEKVDKNWRMGVEYIYDQLKKALEEAGVVEINPVGEKFDHSRHEAAEYVPVEDQKQDHMVVGVVQKGYSLNGKILRPAKVKVGEYKK